MKIPLERISDKETEEKNVKLFMLRLDRAHPTISGNKWYKLKYNLEEARRQKKDTLLTFGGAYSNHIAATAAAGKEFGFKTVGIIRGDELNETQNDVLRFATACGMQLHFISREEYKKKDSPSFTHSLIQSFPHSSQLPEGGTNALAIKGCAEILSHVDIPFDHVCCAAGTGGTITGMISSLQKDQKALGFSVLRAQGYLQAEIKKWLSHFQITASSNFQINEDYHFGGYAKHTPELLKFIADFEKTHKIPLEPVYTGKMMFGIYDLIRKNQFPRNSIIIAVHTGGLTLPC